MHKNHMHLTPELAVHSAEPGPHGVCTQAVTSTLLHPSSLYVVTPTVDGFVETRDYAQLM